MTEDLRYWLQGEGVQNFGDFLSEYFLRNLFLAQPGEKRDLRLIGSCIDDWFVAPEAETPGPMFWGCGLRQEDGFSLERRSKVEILAVRGPLSRSALRLGNSVPIGDPGLLLPALHRATSLWRQSGHSLLVPHFHDQRGDAELLALSGCDALLRPNIPNDLTAISEFIDQLVAADFVLCGSLHAAITAASYSKPFAFWDSGSIDLPFKWQDFAASVQIPCAFQTDIASARVHYAGEIAPCLRIPPMWPLLVAAPLPVRPDAFVRVIELDLKRHGLAVLEAGVSSRAADRLRDRLTELARLPEAAALLKSELETRIAAEQRLNEIIAELTSAGARLSADLAEITAQMEAIRKHEALLQQRLEDADEREAARLQDQAHLQAEHDALRIKFQGETREHGRVRAETARLHRDIAQLRAREAHLASEEARLHLAVQARDHALVVARNDADGIAGQLAAMRGAATWRALAPVRVAARRMPWASKGARRLFRLIKRVVTFQLGSQLPTCRKLRAQVDLLRRSPLFDAAYYLSQRPDLPPNTDAVAHYVTVGAGQGTSPHPLFDGDWYRSFYPRAASSTLSPLAHYVSEGAALSYDPNPLFDTAWYAERYGHAGAEALLHFDREGAASGASPNAFFDAAGYRAQYSDARESSLDPFRHFAQIGIGLGYHPHALFDTEWYLATYSDVAASGMNPLAHYLRIGRAAGYHCSYLQRRLAGFTLEQKLVLDSREDPEASVIIPVYGQYFDTVRCLYAVAAHSGENVEYEVIVLDDNPVNPTAPLLDAIPGLRVHRNSTNLGFLRSCNQAKTLARGRHIVFLNNDTLVGADWLEPLLKPVRQDPRVGMVGCKLLNADGTIQEAGGILFNNGWGHPFGRGDDPAKPEYNYLREVDVVIGAAFLVRRELFQTLGFDDRYAPAFFEEFDLAFEVRRSGFTVLYQPRSEVTHLGSASYGAAARERQSLKNHAKFCVKWASALRYQPAEGDDLFLARQRAGAIGTILMIDDKVPEFDRHAGALTIFQYIKLLHGMGFRLVYCPADLVARQPYTSLLQDLGIEVLYAPADLAKFLEDNGKHLTAVWIARPTVTAPLLDLIRCGTEARILYYPHDLHYLREMRRYQLDGDLSALEESNRMRKLELAIFRDVDCVMTPSPEEAIVIAKDVPSAKVEVIPPYLYPVGDAASLPAEAFAPRRALLFIGGYKHPPNVDAAIWLATDIMPLVWRETPDAYLLLVGDDPTPEVEALSGPRVQVTGYVPELAPYFAQARVSISPLRYGAGVKGKIVSSLEAGIPVVTTAVGNEGIALQDGIEVLLGETPDALAEAALRLLNEPALCASLSAAGVDVIRRRFSEDEARHAIQRVLGMDRCPVCGKLSWNQPNYLDPQTGNWSEHFICAGCHALARSAALAETLIRPYRSKGVNSLREAVPFMQRLRIHEFGFSGPIPDTLRECLRFTCSEYFDLVPVGEYGDDGVMCQDLQGLTFQDNEFDLLISQDVMEHVPDAERAFHEIYRVMKPGGRYVFTVPYSRDREETLIRAELTADGVHHILPPQYHGDPMREEGALAFREFGRDLTPMLTRIGFTVSIYECISEDPAGYVAVFSAVKR